MVLPLPIFVQVVSWIGEISESRASTGYSTISNYDVFYAPQAASWDVEELCCIEKGGGGSRTQSVVSQGSGCGGILRGCNFLHEETGNKQAWTQISLVRSLLPGHRLHLKDLLCVDRACQSWDNGGQSLLLARGRDSISALWPMLLRDMRVDFLKDTVLAHAEQGIKRWERLLLKQEFDCVYRSPGKTL